MNFFEAHTKEFFLKIFFVPPICKKLSMEFIFKSCGILCLDYRVNIKLKWHASIVKVTDSFSVTLDDVTFLFHQ